ncbi:MAG: DUF4331 domain-containing protein [Chloroflexota bacterium]|nr:MAG: DUF4331 domain-containing protein [Chloroflexota bacterium]
MSQRKPVWVYLIVLLTAASFLAVGQAPGASRAASHREAPLISLDPTADITDFFMFRSYEPGNEDKVVLIMDVIPGEEPSSGPNYWNFDPNVLYVFHIDNNMDGKTGDVRFEFRFENEFTGVPKALGLFLSYLGNVPPTDGSVVPPITALEGPGSEGIGLRQRYTITMVRNGQKTTLAEGLIVVPSNVGPRTMPDYNALASQGIYELDHDIRVFAGQRDDPFYIDLGAVFDTINLRAPGTDMLSGFNVHTIALEVPASMLTRDGLDPDETEQPVLGAYASTSRPRVTVLRNYEGESSSEGWVQVQRLANPLVNEAIIGTEDKDRWNAKHPSQEADFVDYYTNSRFAAALSLVFGVEASPLLDLRDVMLTYTPGDYSKLSELLRLNVSVPPMPLASQERLTVLAGDNAGWPNGRRPIDDVTDVAIQVIGGTNFQGAGDGVDANDMPLTEAFPFLPTPWDGRNRVHTNP